MLIIVIKSLIIGAIGGAAVAAGAARMFHTPAIQGMGAFRTLGELNASNGDPVAHFSFGLGFLFNAAATAVGAGALTPDVYHRIVPNWAAAALLARDKKVENTLHNPAKMAFSGMFVGMFVVTFLNTVASVVPEKLAMIAKEILTPAANLMVQPIMPIIFWLAAMDAGKTTGIWGTVVGGISQMISGNAVPGIVLGILIGQTAEENGYKNKATIILISIVIIMFAAIGHFRGFWTKLGLY